MNISDKIKQFYKGESSLFSFITISLVLVVIGSIVYNLIKSGETLLDESMVSFAAFTMLIYTSYLQNRDLKLTRKELEMTREELKGTKEVQEEQKNQMIQSNEMMKETIVQSRYFELLKIKEETYSKIDREDKKKNELSTYISDYKFSIFNKLLRISEESTMDKIVRSYIHKNMYYNLTVDDYKNESFNISPKFLCNVLNECEDANQLKESLKTTFDNVKPSCNMELTRNQEKLFKTHKTIVDLIRYIDEKEHPKAPLNAFRSSIKNISDMGIKFAKFSLFRDPEVKIDYTLFELYKSTLLKEEKLFYKCVNNDLTFDELNK